MSIGTFVEVGRSKFQVMDDDTVFLHSKGEKKLIEAGKTVEEARRKARNLRAIRVSAAAREAARGK